MDTLVIWEMEREKNHTPCLTFCVFKYTYFQFNLGIFESDVWSKYAQEGGMIAYTEKMDIIMIITRKIHYLIRLYFK